MLWLLFGAVSFVLADRLRKRGESVAGKCRLATKGDGDSRCAGRLEMASHPTTTNGKHDARARVAVALDCCWHCGAWP